MASTRDFLAARYRLSPDSLELVNGKVDWQGFRSYVGRAGLPCSEEILNIISAGDDSDPVAAVRRMKTLKAHDSGRTWRLLAKEVLPRFRRSRIITVVVPAAKAVTERTPAVVTAPAGSTEAEAPEEEGPAEARPGQASPASTTECARSWHLSTNVAELALLIANIAGGYDFACHWSARLSLHYSAVNYGSAKRKFRTLMVRPEVRWRQRSTGNSLFAEAHLAMAYYNVALKHWNYRVQDARGRTPALGGGIGIGYRLRLHSHWALEAQIGAGLYRLKYDRFENRPNGPLVTTRSRLWGGIDNVALSVVYNFSPLPR